MLYINISGINKNKKRPWKVAAKIPTNNNII